MKVDSLECEFVLELVKSSENTVLSSVSAVDDGQLDASMFVFKLSEFNSELSLLASKFKRLLPIRGLLVPGILMVVF